MVFLIFFCFSYASELTERTKAVSLFRACVLADMAHTSRLLLALLLVLLHAPGSLGQSSFCCNNGFCSRASLTEVPSCLSSSITTLSVSFRPCMNHSLRVEATDNSRLDFSQAILPLGIEID
eukprot:m.64570 g.64570  ORF g.64570 m.64570 type:complete len:122 (-) comp49717_c1_seq10:1998-2363(-)